MMQKGRRCCRNGSKSVGLFLIAIGCGLFLAYIIPRYFLITIMGLGLIAEGVCIIIKK